MTYAELSAFDEAGFDVIWQSPFCLRCRTRQVSTGRTA